MVRRVLLAGAGQLGSRYLQGMALFREPLSIWTYDPWPASLDRAQERWAEATSSGVDHEVRYVQQVHEVPEAFDLAVVATTADVRPALVKAIAAHARVDNWILEKVLAQNSPGLSVVQAAVGDARAWVNTPMHLWSLYRRLRAEFGDGPIRARIGGFRGLACNAIHYIDLVSRWNRTEVERVDTTGLDVNWHPAKRDGFYEVEGSLDVEFADGSVLHLSSGGGGAEFQARIVADGQDWQVFEPNGYAISADGRRVDGAVEFQSALTAPLMTAIFETGTCGLPTLSQSIAQHTPYLSAMLAHWNAQDRADTVLPIT